LNPICSAHDDSFENSGEFFTSPVAHEDPMEKMGTITARVASVGGFAEPQREFPQFQRINWFVKSQVRP
jgi:hypothetical protein